MASVVLLMLASAKGYFFKVINGAVNWAPCSVAGLLHTLTAPVHSCLIMLLVNIVPLMTHTSDHGREGQIGDS